MEHGQGARPLWQLGFAWLEHDQLVHVVFEGYPGHALAAHCPASGGALLRRQGRHRATIDGFEVTWYDHNQASHWHHLAAVFAANGYVYVVSMHVDRPYDSEQKVRAA